MAAEILFHEKKKKRNKILVTVRRRKKEGGGAIFKLARFQDTFDKLPVVFKTTFDRGL